MSPYLAGLMGGWGFIGISLHLLYCNTVVQNSRNIHRKPMQKHMCVLSFYSLRLFLTNSIILMDRQEA